MEYRIIESGFTSDILDMGDGNICKLYKNKYGYNDVKKEVDNIRLLSETKIHVDIPKVDKIITMNDRWGFVANKIKGDSLLNRMKNGNIKKDKGVKILISVQRCFWESKVDGLSSYSRCLNDREINVNGIEKMDEKYAKCVIHGDVHPGNIIVSNNGNLAVIDFFTLSYGPKEYDIAKTFFLLRKRDCALGELYLNYFRKKYQDIKCFLDFLDDT